ncbi:MAG: hypothetical protein RBR29_00670 [Castellaniella sp.]|uniref:hypothetical protein n=1 Tax=Castellaniella sp. TaxID=1955812 RepID=UPI002A36CE3D|nr:hypothetical protein [Castellaniella sp.]MDY0308299.1 hypothetical protein [Castellaniella sp.]
MKPERNESPSRQDHALLRKVLLKLTATSRILAAVLVVTVALIWYDALNRLLAFGNGIDYAGNRIVGAEATALLQRYNPYFWGALATLCSLLLAYLTWLAVRAILVRARLRPVDATSFQQLSSQLSGAALDVLLWAWQTRDEPLRVGDLMLTRTELSAGRAARLHRAAEQLAILENARQRS